MQKPNESLKGGKMKKGSFSQKNSMRGKGRLHDWSQGLKKLYLKKKAGKVPVSGLRSLQRDGFGRERYKE